MAKKEEKSGILTSIVIGNDGNAENCIRLVRIKEIFAQQLPKMPKEYITRLVMDR
jgi:histone acetyltransferase